MTTKKLVPRASGEGAMGVDDNAWGEAYYDTGNFNKGLFVSGHNITQVIAETVTQGGLGGEWTRNGLDIYYNGGNVGIGTTDPLHVLDVYGFSKVIGITSTHADTTRITHASLQSDPNGWGSVNALSNVGNLVVQLNSNGDSFLNGGNVGIGTKNPSQKLDIHGKFTVNSDGTALWGNIPNGITGRLSWDGGATGKIILRAEANNTLNLGANGSHNHIVIGTNGNVGIGTTSPIGPLHVSSVRVNTINLTRKLDIRNSANGAASKIEGGALVNTTPSMGGAIGFALLDSDGAGTGSDTEGYLYFETKDSGASLTEKMRINSAGNVGIGTPDPSSTLTVSRLDQNETNAALSVYRGDTSPGDRPTTPIFNLFNGTGGASEVFRVQGDGNVGIGTTNPGAALAVAGSFKLNNTAGGTLYTASNDVYKNHLTSSSLKHSITLGTAGWRNASVIESVTGTTPSGFSTQGLCLNATYGSSAFTSASVHVDCHTGNGDISFLTGTGAAAPTTKFKLQNNGNVGIGTTSPGGKLHLLDSRTTTHTDYTLTVQNDGTTPHGLRVHQKNADPSLIGASSGYSILTTSGSFQCFYVTNNGDTFNKYGNYGVISDKRLKENITDATAKTEDLKKVRVVNYNLIKDDTKQIGVIAQELEQVFPGLVSESEHQDGETYKSVKMSLFIPMLLKGFQEQQQLIEDLRSEVEALKNK